MKPKLEAGVAAHVIDQHGTEAGNAGSPGAANAGIDNAVRAVLKKAGGQLLRELVALRNRAGPQEPGETRRPAAKIVKLGGKVSEIVVACGDFFVRPIDFAQLLELVKGNLGNGGFAFQACIPCTAQVAVESACREAQHV